MAYYPNNFYSNYSYNVYQQPPGIQTKIVDGYDAVRVSDVPMGNYGIFPKGDFSEIYFKSWNNDGTTKITTSKQVEENKNITTETLLKRINELETKINNFIFEKVEDKKEEQPIKRKEVNLSEY